MAEISLNDYEGYIHRFWCSSSSIRHRGEEVFFYADIIDRGEFILIERGREHRIWVNKELVWEPRLLSEEDKLSVLRKAMYGMHSAIQLANYPESLNKENRSLVKPILDEYRELIEGDVVDRIVEATRKVDLGYEE